MCVDGNGVTICSATFVAEPSWGAWLVAVGNEKGLLGRDSTSDMG